MSDSVILIPARMEATRFFGKPLHLIAGKPMIIRCYEQAIKANIAPVYICAGNQEILDCAIKYGAQAVLTENGLPSGTDRIAAALQEIDKEEKLQYILNLQGDLPTIDPVILQQIAGVLRHNHDIDIATPIVPTDEAEGRDPHIVKVACAPTEQQGLGYRQGRALYFSRGAIPYGAGEIFHHLGIYGFKRESLLRFVNLPPSPLELREKLEQLRALEYGMRIEALVVDTIPQSVDIPADVEKIEKILKK